MRKLFQILLPLIVVLNVSAQNPDSKSIYQVNTKSNIYADSPWNIEGENIYFMHENVGIGTKIPKTKLEVIGNNTDSDGNIQHGVITIKNNNYSRFRTEAYSDTHFRNPQIMGLRGRGTYDNPQDVLPGDRVFGIYGNVIENRKMKASPIATVEFFMGNKPSSGEITFSTLSPNAEARDERMRIDQDGNVGIGTANPRAKLHVAEGDIYIEDISKGIIMKSPNGQCWRGTVDNSGQLNFTKTECPVNDKMAFKKDSIVSQLIQVFPNPAKRKLNFEIKNASNIYFRYHVSTLHGQIVMTGICEASNSEIDISSLSSAMYFISFYNQKNALIASKKFVKQ